MRPTSTNVIICEEIRSDDDAILSAIRIVDVFFVTPPTDNHEPDRFSFRVLLMAKYEDRDGRDHNIQLELVRPTGDRKVLGNSETFALKTRKYPDAQPGVNLTAVLSLKATHMGTHYVVALIDGEEAGRTP